LNILIFIILLSQHKDVDLICRS